MMVPFTHRLSLRIFEISFSGNIKGVDCFVGVESGEVSRLQTQIFMSSIQVVVKIM